MKTSLALPIGDPLLIGVAVVSLLALVAAFVGWHASWRSGLTLGSIGE